MRAVTVARNYAEAVLELAEKDQQIARYGELLDAVAGAIETSPRVLAVLMSPRVTKAQKSAILTAALADAGAPPEFGLFLQAVVKRSRQGLLREIALQYADLVDLKFNRVRAGVTVARAPDPALREQIVQALSRVMGKEVIPRFEEDPAILGGMVVRVGDRIFDGSVRRRLTTLKRRLLPG